MYFAETVACQTAHGIAVDFAMLETIDEMDRDDKFFILGIAAGRGKDEFICCLIAMLPPELRCGASNMFDYVSRKHE